jgi:hypothetical protein
MTMDILEVIDTIISDIPVISERKKKIPSLSNNISRHILTLN